ncbi:hypothetical protein DAEQUDRAFT_809241 [Daedalea quercina L-15889]|uniref:Uncharacterized protein n=1 Tax=Daedalea quercina L-15889 TaxID=1314783 RepID=A0A165SR45_9APHY|nr:hypothetical protein DAEQUDRAFT_809241 [Daedalea quercina L-15889]
MSDGSNLWSWITGAVGFATVLPLLYTIVVAQLPVSKVKILEEALEDTRTLLESVIEKNLLSDVRFINDCRRRLAFIEERSEKLKLSAYGAKTTFQQLKGMICGLSLGIHRLYQGVHRLRAKISETTSEAQERLEHGAHEAPERDAEATVSTPPPSDMEEESCRHSVDITDLCDPHKRLVEMSYSEHSVPTAFDRAEQSQPPLALGFETVRYHRDQLTVPSSFYCQ